jgi:hypothetical protein
MARPPAARAAAAVRARAARPAPPAAPRARRGLLSLTLLLPLLLGSLPAGRPQQAPLAPALRPGCPGVSPSGECGPRCQEAICGAFSHFFHVTHGPSWRNAMSGWPVDHAGPACAAWLAAWPPPPGAANAPADGAPRYCHISGVRCCDAAAPLPELCPFQWAPTNLTLANNNLTGAVADPELWSALGHLMACGLRRLILQGNRVRRGAAAAPAAGRGMRRCHALCRALAQGPAARPRVPLASDATRPPAAPRRAAGRDAPGSAAGGGGGLAADV